jgi:hypothetical protein
MRLVIGPTGIGKSSALPPAHKACRDGYTIHYARVPSRAHLKADIPRLKRRLYC